MTSALPSLPLPLFNHRRNAGEALASMLPPVGGEAIVLALPRGGVAVARPIADALRAPLDVMVARKLGVPGLSEVALGAIAEGWSGIAEDSVRWYIGIPTRVAARVVERERREVERRVQTYRAGQPLPNVRGKTVVLVDDGIATGATLRAAALALRSRRPQRIVAAVPVGSPQHCGDVRAVVDELVMVATPEPFEMVSTWYEDFAPVSDDEVARLLGRPSAPRAPEAMRHDVSDEVEVAIPIAGLDGATGIVGDLGVPNDEDAREPLGLVILAHGGGSSRGSYRNRYLAGRLRMAGWATLRVDLLTPSERDADATTGDLRFDVALIARRLQCATEWARDSRPPGADRIVLFGASTGAAAAVVTAAARPDLVAAVASRGGRVDLAGDSLAHVRAPLLMVVGGADADTLALNRDAAHRLTSRSTISVIPDAGHTFDEPGALGRVGERVVRWLRRVPRGAQRRPWLEALGLGNRN